MAVTLIIRYSIIFFCCEFFYGGFFVCLSTQKSNINLIKNAALHVGRRRAAGGDRQLDCVWSGSFHLCHHFIPAVGLQQNGGSLVLYLGDEEGVWNPSRCMPGTALAPEKSTQKDVPWLVCDVQ